MDDETGPFLLGLILLWMSNEVKGKGLPLESLSYAH